MIRVVIADDETIIREGIKLIIEQDVEIKVVGCAANGRDVLKLCKMHSPNLVLMDVMMPDCDGIEGTKLIKDFNKSIKVIILTTFYDEEKILRALSNGADGYVLKAINSQELISTIKSTVNGLRVIHKDVFNTVIKHVNLSTEFNHNDKSNSDLNLSNNEIKIIQMVVQGKSNKDIASTVHLSLGRVKNIISEILTKLELKDRTQLAVFAVKNNLI